MILVLNTRSIVNASIFTLLLMLFSQLVFAKANEFPGRKLYPAVKYIELKDLKKALPESIVVDVRSAYEYETLRVKGALNISISSKTYVDKMRKLRADNPTKKIFVYCNGKTCMKSYKAVMKCRRNGIKDIISFDAGIMDWAKAYPKNAVLLGKSPVDTNKIISKKRFKSKLVTPDVFESLVSDKTAIVIDLRDRFQREATGIFSGLEERVYLDDKKSLEMYVKKANKEGKTLLIYDAAGKQVRWLMYYLEDKNTKSYKFMKGGAHAYFKALRSKFTK